MTNDVAQRLLWTVETLDVQATDRLLEIGCGHGVAVTLVCDRLRGGHITAIDRSAKMIALAEKRNRAYIAAGTAAFAASTLAGADFGDEQFTKIFASNVGLFRTARDAELATITRHLSADGALYLFHQDPWVPKSPTVTQTLTQFLDRNGFTIERVLRQEMEPLAVNCVIAFPSSVVGLDA
jgi:ubiquinone/menaquinone biosynthesis C-methylase UbiE